MNELSADLPSREHELAKLTAECLHNNKTAEKLVITESAVQTHLRSRFQKLQIDRRAS